MGNLELKLIQLGQYCDCLQNWKKYQIQDQHKSQSNLFISENQSNMDLAIQKVFEVNDIDNVFDKELQALQQRLKKRKKLKAQYQLQKQIQKQHQMEEIQRERQLQLEKNEIQKQKILNQQKIRRNKQMADQKKRREDIQKKLIANKKHKRIRTKNDTQATQLKLNNKNRSFSTTDEFILNFGDKFKDNTNDSNNDKSKQFENVFQNNRQNDNEDQFIHSYRPKKKATVQALDIIDLQKLNPVTMNNEISQLVLKKLNDRQKQASKTMPLQLKSHRPEYSNFKDHLRFKQNTEEQFQSDIPFFGDDGFQSVIIQNKNNQYFLDDQDKQQYLKEMFN